MPSSNQTIDLKKLKTDPGLWMRLATPIEGSNKMGNVFLEKENPFTTSEGPAMDKIEKLAAEGKLYVREHGRSRHFRKAEKDGEQLKLGEQKEAATSGPYDPVLSFLLRSSYRYFKWMGAERIANWFDKYVQRYDAYRTLDKHYKDEYDSMSKTEKEALKKLRKQEKAEASARKRLEKAEKEVEKARQELDKILGRETQPEKGEMDAPLNSAPLPVEEQKLTNEMENQLENEKTLQQEQEEERGLIDDENESDFRITVNGKEYTPDNIDSAPKEVQDMLKALEAYTKQMDAQKQAETDEPLIDAKDSPTSTDDGPLIDDDNESDFHITVNGKEYTPDNIDSAPKEVQDVLKALEAYTKQMDAQKQAETDEPLIDPKASPIGSDNKPLIDLNDFPESVKNEHQANFDNISVGMKDEPLVNLNDFPESVKNEHQANFDNISVGMKDEPLVNLNDFPESVKNEHQADFNDASFNLVQQPPVVVPAAEQQNNDIPPVQENAPRSVQEAPAVKSRSNTYDRERLLDQLGGEKLNIRNARYWSDNAATALFSSDKHWDLMEQYWENQDHPTINRNVVVGMVSGIFAPGEEANGGPENYQQMMEDLLAGRPLDTANGKYIHNGMTAFQNGWEANKAGNPEAMTEMLSNAVRELSKQASHETQLSPRNVMIGKLISNTIVMAQENGIPLNLNKKEMITAAGAVSMAKVTEKYYAARQYLAKEPMDITSEKGSDAVRDLLTGKAVEDGLKTDRRAGEEITSTQILMGSRQWSAERLAQMVSSSTVKKKISENEVRDILEQPDGKTAQKAGNKALAHVINVSRRERKAMEQNKQLERTNEQERNQPQQMNPFA